MTYGKLVIVALVLLALGAVAVAGLCAVNPSFELGVRRWIGSFTAEAESRPTPPPLPAWQGGPESPAEKAERGVRAAWYRDSQIAEARAARAAHARDHFGRYGRKIPAKQPPVVSLTGDDLRPVGE